MRVVNSNIANNSNITNFSEFFQGVSAIACTLK